MKLNFTLLLIICNVLSYSQVTVGMEEAPSAGALLQIKNKKNTVSGGENATKGLGIPRVKLTGLGNISNDIKGVTDANKLEHTGLIVYAVEKFDYPYYCPGLYVWSGEKWVGLIPESNYTKPNIKMFDGDGNEYDAKWFSDDACNPATGLYWTTSNLYSTKNKNGQTFTTNQTVYLNPAATGAGVSGVPINSIQDLANKNINFGEWESVNNTHNKSINGLDYSKRFGLLYNFNQAQEACPTGWRLPTLQDRQRLAKAHGYNEDTASSRMRVNRNYFVPSNSLTGNKWGEVDPSTEKSLGFNALPCGNIKNLSSGIHGTAEGFASWVIFWDSTGVGWYIRHNTLSFNQDTTYGTGVYISVRCVHD